MPPGGGPTLLPFPWRPASSPCNAAPPVLSAVRAGRRAGFEHDRSPLRSWIVSNINGLACRISSIMETHAVRHARLRAVWLGAKQCYDITLHSTFVSGFQTLRGKRNRTPASREPVRGVLSVCLRRVLMPGAQLAHCASQATGAAPGSFTPVSTARAVRRIVLPALRSHPSSLKPHKDYVLIVCPWFVRREGPCLRPTVAFPV